MLISPALNQRINEEIGRELFASHQYLSTAAYFDDLALKLLSKKFVKQASEERDHAQKFIDYLMLVGGAVQIPAIDAPKTSFPGVEAAIQDAYDWEIEITNRINDLMALAIEEKDYAAQDFLRWFVTEQLEEVATMGDLLKIVKQVGERQVIMVEAYLVHNG